MFSIIIPTYNSAKTLRETLDSLATQYYHDFEVLIIDGQSKDHTLSIAESFKDRLPLLKVFSEPDKGIYDAMNKGIKKSQGKWLYFLGSDDILIDSKVLEDVASFISKNVADLVYGDTRFKSKGEILGGEYDLEKLLTYSNICHQSIFYKRDIFEKTGCFNLKYKMWADWDLNIRIFSHPEFTTRHVDKIIALFNDMDGFSGTEKVDSAFSKLVPALLVEDYKKKLSDLTDSYNQIRYSRSYQIGQMILNPIVWLKTHFKS